jgi:hypothetical protein
MFSISSALAADSGSMGDLSRMNSAPTVNHLPHLAYVQRGEDDRRDHSSRTPTNVRVLHHVTVLLFPAWDCRVSGSKATSVKCRSAGVATKKYW